MRPSLLPGPDRRRAPQPRPRRIVGPAVRDRPPLSRRRRASDAVAAARRRQGAARLAVGQGAGVRRVRRQGRSARLARSGRRAGRQSAGLPRRRADLASGPLGQARPWAQDDRRQLRRASSGPRQEPRRAGGRGRRRNLSRRDSRAALERPRARRLMRRRRCRRSPATSPSSFRPSSPPTRSLRAIRGSDKEAITGVRLFDRFESADGLSWRSKSPSSRATRASPTSRSARFPSASPPPRRN